jgi:Ca-activated chloride channel homolog
MRERGLKDGIQSMSIRSIILALTLIWASITPSFAQDGSRVILVLDASGSMRGKIDGKSKMDIAKQVVGSIIKTWKPQDELGLIAYGHREKGSCSDIEVLREPLALDAESYMKAVKGLNPKGKTPMTAAVKMAAESLQYTEKKATVILVSDGIETCDLDPCTVAEDLEKLGVGLTVHTVGFGLDDKGAVAQLKCLAEKTGGTFSTANSADELQKALAKTVAEQPEQKAEIFENNVIGHIVMAKGVELPEKFQDPTWAFFESVAGQRGKQIGTEYNADMKYNIPKPGDYIVRISEDEAEVEVAFKVEEGKQTKIDASFEAGVVKMLGYMDEQTPIAIDNTNATWRIYNEKGKLAGTEYGGEHIFMANAGKHKMELVLGDAKTEQVVEFLAGQTNEVKMILGAGTIEVTAVFSKGGDVVPEGATIELRKGKADLEGKFERLTTEFKSPSVFSAPAGLYKIYVQKDYAEALAEVELKSGARETLQVDMNAGYLALKGAGAKTFEVYAAKKKLDGSREQIATEFGDEMNKAFNSGSYHVIVYGEDSAILGEKDFEVKAGERTEGSVP